MRKIMHQSDVHAALETVWKLLRDKVENPQGYVPGIVETKILERYDDGVLREVKAQGMDPRRVEILGGLLNNCLW